MIKGSELFGAGTGLSRPHAIKTNRDNDAPFSWMKASALMIFRTATQPPNCLEIVFAVCWKSSHLRNAHINCSNFD